MSYDELVESILTAQEQMLKHGIEANSVTLNGRKYGKLIENLPPNMKPTIFGMAMKADYALPDDYDYLVQYEPPQPQTNADKLCSMSDEELAEFYGNDVDACPPGRDSGKCIDELYAHGEEPYPSVKQCMECWLDWLRQEANEEMRL